MLDYKVINNPKTNKPALLETSASGKAIMRIPEFNKGTAFSEKERKEFEIDGKLPSQVESLQQQVERAYQQFCAYDEPLNRNIYLQQILNSNIVLFYKLLETYLTEMLPIVYTPIVGTAVQAFQRKFRDPRGLYISYPQRNMMEQILNNRTHPNIDLILCTDGEGVLGIGDQGIGAMAIAIAKLTVYTSFGQVDPMHTLPIMLDVGTNNQELLDDPFYLGWRSPRISNAEYDDFIEQFVTTVKKLFPDVMLHWEDLGRKNAQKYLDRYSDKICTFNDDIEGTGIVSLAALISATKRTSMELNNHRILIFGAGSAGMGVTHQIYRYLCTNGMNPDEAKKVFWLVDREGLLTTETHNTTEAQQPFLRDPNEITNHNKTNENHQDTLYDIISEVKPTILIGTSAQADRFTQNIVTKMLSYCERPIILPLSNPNEKAEANPADLYRWSEGKVITATGSPFPNITYAGEQIEFSQCNNYLAFPGIGLGVISVKAQKLTENMRQAACSTIAGLVKDHPTRILPTIEEARDASRLIAIAVAEQAQKDGVAKIMDDAATCVDANRWEAEYLPYKHVK